MADDWDVLPEPEKGDPTREALYAAIGEALTEWERLAEDLAEIYSILIGKPEMVPGEGPAIREYGELGFRKQCDKLTSAAKAFFLKHPADPTLPTKFYDLIDKCRKFANRRNDIAHGKCEFVSGCGYLWSPPFYNPRRVKPDWSMAYCSSREILTYAERFRELQGMADYLNRALYSVSQQPVGQ